MPLICRLCLGVSHLPTPFKRGIPRRPSLLQLHRLHLRILAHHHGLHFPGSFHIVHLLLQYCFCHIEKGLEYQRIINQFIRICCVYQTKAWNIENSQEKRLGRLVWYKIQSKYWLNILAQSDNSDERTSFIICNDLFTRLVFCKVWKAKQKSSF